MSKLIKVPTFATNRQGQVLQKGLGVLSAIEQKKDVPFAIKRVFFIHNVEVGRVRGGHRHIKLRQFLISISGKFRVVVHDEERIREYILDKPDSGLLLEPKDWHTMECLEKKSVLLVLASDKYMPNDYVNQRKLDSLSIFFPFYNDEGTVERQINAAYEIGRRLAKKLEVIAIHGGASRDKTYKKILKMKKKFPRLKVLDKSDNKEGYAVIKYGFGSARNEWIFYTDGDAQYHLEEDLPVLVEAALATRADIVNGFKIRRGDGWLRRVVGDGYAYFSKFLFDSPIRDVDCDFRLVRKSVVAQIDLESQDASVLPEMVKKLEMKGCRFVEVPVSHYKREYGKSNYTVWALFREKLVGDIKLYFKLRNLDNFSRNERLVKFAVVGGFATLIQGILFNLFIKYSGFGAASAVILSDQLAVVAAFFLNGKFTFKRVNFGNKVDFWQMFGKYYVSVFVSTLIQAGVVWVGVKAFGNSFWVANVLFIISVGVAGLWNYIMQSRVVWKNSPRVRPAI